MERVVGVEGSEEKAKVEEGVSGETGPVLKPSVDGDGRLVPATDDEVLVVEDLLKGEKDEHFSSDSEQPTKCSKNEKFPLERTQPCLEGSFQSEKHESDIDNLKIQLDNAADVQEENVQQAVTVCQLASSPNSYDIHHSSGFRYTESLVHFQNASSSSDSANCAMPDFSRLKGEICLDNLSVKELQETFRATFGRETSVKDKQWLKRRISMGLSNSCDFSTTNFIIKNNIVVKQGKQENSHSGTILTDFVVGVSDETVRAPVDGLDKLAKGLSNIDEQKESRTLLEPSSVAEDPNLESRAAKRVRKPTKRYIEEISEVESSDSSGRLITSVKSSEHRQLDSKDRARSILNVWPDGRPMVTRQDSLGGSGVKVPYVSRIRRSRPRENFMPLMRLQPSGIDMATRLVKKSVGQPETPVEDVTVKVQKARLSSGWVQEPLISAAEETKDIPERKSMEIGKDIELKRLDAFEDNSDDNVVAVSPLLGRIRRKHHRPWSLTEVVKLVEGVAKYGPGRWSEIKRVAFAAYSYRTSVDLKDKWRNLLRASCAQLPGDKGNTRKHSAIPIPAQILVRVRELADMQAQVPPKLGSNKFNGHGSGDGDGDGDRSVIEIRPGFL